MQTVLFCGVSDTLKNIMSKLFFKSVYPKSHIYFLEDFQRAELIYFIWKGNLENLFGMQLLVHKAGLAISFFCCAFCASINLAKLHTTTLNLLLDRIQMGKNYFHNIHVLLSKLSRKRKNQDCKKKASHLLFRLEF